MSGKQKSLWEKIYGVFHELEIFLIVAMTMTIGLLIFAEVIMRSVLHMRGISWLNEFSRYMLILTTILGSSMAASENGHMVMDTLYNVLPAKAAFGVKGLVHLLCAGFWSYIDYWTWKWVLRLVKIGTRAESVKMPMYIIWIPVGFFIATMAIRYFVEAWLSFGKMCKKAQDFDQMNENEM